MAGSAGGPSHSMIAFVAITEIGCSCVLGHSQVLVFSHSRTWRRSTEEREPFSKVRIYMELTCVTNCELTCVTNCELTGKCVEVTYIIDPIGSGADLFVRTKFRGFPSELYGQKLSGQSMTAAWTCTPPFGHLRKDPRTMMLCVARSCLTVTIKTEHRNQRSNPHHTPCTILDSHNYCMYNKQQITGPK